MLGLASCRAPAPPPVTATPVPAPALPLGVIAERTGKQGVVRVEERGGLRLLTINGVVQGAAPLKGASPADPLVDLVLAMRPEAKTALVIGLGTGRTASAFAQRGIEVDAVELEAAVVELARAHFEFTGRCDVADGLDYLASAEKSFDVVVVDAWSGGEPGPLFTSAALMKASGRARLLLAARRGGTPGDPALEPSLHSMGQHHALFGSGLGTEAQTLYLFGSRTPFQATGLDGLAAWPLGIPGQGSTKLFSEVAMGPPAADGSRRVQLTGYLVRLDEDGDSLALDLPHWEMGAIRYRLHGDATKPLDVLLPAKTKFPTTGEIGSDGDTAKTLKALLGGGDVMRSDTRFSPVAVTVVGIARFRSAVDPDDVFAGFLLLDRKAEAREKLLPYGGVLYELDVERVAWSFTRKDWDALDRSLSPIMKRAEAKLRDGELGAAVKLLEEYLAAFGEGVGSAAPRMASGSDVRVLSAWLLSFPVPDTEFVSAVNCDRASAFPATAPGGWSNPHVEELRDALSDCAVAAYERLLTQPAGPQTRTVAARLLAFYEFSEVAKDKKRAAALHNRFKDLEPLYDPPDLELLRHKWADRIPK